MVHSILFSGHMIDKPEREEPRFPPEKEDTVSDLIRSALVELKSNLKEATLKGIAGAACGGDVLFHEACESISIPSVVYLALPKEKFKKTSVEFAGEDWVKRFEVITQHLPVHYPEKQIPEEADIWKTANEWMLSEALKNGPKNATLIALWDENKGDKSGGAEHMISIAKQAGVQVVLLSI